VGICPRSFRKCVMSRAHNTPTLPISYLESLASESSEFSLADRRLSACLDGRWSSKLKTAYSAADGFEQVCSPAKKPLHANFDSP
jgi:hypothetical protein